MGAGQSVPTSLVHFRLHNSHQSLNTHTLLLSCVCVNCTFIINPCLYYISLPRLPPLCIVLLASSHRLKKQHDDDDDAQPLPIDKPKRERVPRRSVPLDICVAPHPA